MKSSTFWGILFSLFVLASGCGYFQDSVDGTQHPQVGTRMAGVQLSPLTTNAEPLDDQALRGKVVLLNFWASWCGPCRVEFPHLVGIYDEFKNDPNFKYVSVALENETGPDALQAIEPMMKQNVATHPVWSDTEGRDTFRNAGLRYKFDGIPATVILDRDGTARAIWNGYSSGIEKEMRSVLQELLKPGR
jgi:cytochrome c biogenesis protein CcmG, thiol:disulfide interchange protein DsbE